MKYFVERCLMEVFRMSTALSENTTSYKRQSMEYVRESLFMES